VRGRQELNPQTWPIARSDRLILEPEGQDAENIKLGSTLSHDRKDDDVRWQFLSRKDESISTLHA